MKNKNRIITFATLCMLLISVFSFLSSSPSTWAQGGANLTGTIADSGEDTDSNGKFDFLKVAVEINVTVAGMYQVSADSLIDQYNIVMWFYVSNESNLDAGLQWITLSFYGPAFSGEHFSPANISSIWLYRLDGYYKPGEAIYNVPLSRIYSYTEFDVAAELTGRIYDQGVDLEYDMLFDYLSLGVEINVAESGNYQVYIDSLSGGFMNSSNVPIYNASEAFLTEGVHRINFTVYGPTIFLSLHQSRGNVSAVTYCSLKVRSGFMFYTIGNQWSIPLSRQYAYYEFESHAMLTGKIVDHGVDVDGDGLFDYLNVGVEVNVTESGRYLITIEWIEGSGVGNTTAMVYYFQKADTDLVRQLQLVNFSYPGQMIAFNHFNPQSLRSLRLSEQPSNFQLGYLPTASLSRQYYYTEFNEPLTEAQIEFTVYPNATLDMRGSLNQTRMYPVFERPRFNASLGFQTIGNLTMASAKGTAKLQTTYEPGWPINSTVATLLARLYNDMLNAQLNATVYMPPAARSLYPLNSTAGDMDFSALYSNGVVRVSISGAGQPSPQFTSFYPFNISDLRLLANYANGLIFGNVTFQALAGFPLSDITAHFSGTETEIMLTGYVNVIYGNFMGTVFNSTIVDQAIEMFKTNFTGRGSQSMYNATRGLVELAGVNTTRTPIGPPEGTRVDYNATLRGNFTGLLAMFIAENIVRNSSAYQLAYAALNSAFSSVDNASLRLNFYNDSKIVSFDLNLYSDVKELWSNVLQKVPSTILPGLIDGYEQSQVEAWLKIANATAYGIENARIDVTYSGHEQRFDVKASLTANMTKLRTDIKPFIPDATRASLGWFPDMFESYLNTTYCEPVSGYAFVNHTYGMVQFEANCTMIGNFRAQLNHLKNVVFYGMFNDTDIDIGNFQMTANEGKDWTTITFSGVRMYPPKDEIDLVRFKLLRWMGLAGNFTMPLGEKLGIAFIGGFDGTNVVLFSASDIAQTPNDTSLDYKRMTWESASFKGLKELLFKIAYQGVVNYAGQTFYVPIFTNSTGSSFNFDPNLKQIRFTVTGESGSGFCNVTIPKAMLHASSAEWIITIDSNVLDAGDFNVTENAEYVFIYFEYAHSSHTISITGTWVVSEYPSYLLPLTLIIISIAAGIIAFKQRRKISAMAMKCQMLIRALAA